jgi:L-aminopeptidase/D-esterase-like protein
VLTDVPGVRVGHWTDPDAQTGCTVVLFPPGTVAAAEVRGGAPASRELAVLAPEATVAHIDAAVLTGGSAYGLAAVDGVLRFCEERGRGVPTSGGPVPIVPGLALFDLGVGDPRIRPNAAAGHTAALAAERDEPASLGPVGAGAGARVGHRHGAAAAEPGGVRAATARHGDLVVGALIAVNGYGDIDVDGRGLDRLATDLAVGRSLGPQALFGHTTIGVVATNARLDKLGCLIVAQGAHDGLARAIIPAHTRYDGDAFISAATGTAPAEIDVVRALAAAVVERAIRAAAPAHG